MTSSEFVGRVVSVQEAGAAAQRLMNSHFGNPDRARVQIPVSPFDDDIVVTAFIAQRGGLEGDEGFKAWWSGGEVTEAVSHLEGSDDPMECYEHLALLAWLAARKVGE